MLDDLFEIVALMPWWIGVVLAIAAYIALHMYATAELPAQSIAPGQMGAHVASPALKVLAGILQYGIPIVLLGGALASGITQIKRSKLVFNVAAGHSHAVLLDMKWQEFEGLVAEGFKLKGYAVTQRGGSASDGGVDLVLRKGTEKAFVQCKQWRATKVPVETVRELYGVMAAEGATNGFVVTSGQFTRDATDFASGRNIELLDGPKLFSMFAAVQGAGGARKEPLAEARQVAPSCPNCKKEMVRRVAKKGANAGEWFWGCSSYPACRGTRPAT
jgi:restriction system protein